jgi:hypothetical protein
MVRKPIEFRNSILSPALQWLRPGGEPRMIEQLIRAGRVADAAALAELLVFEADRPTHITSRRSMRRRGRQQGLNILLTR